MPFETFKRQRVPLTNEPAVTIQKRGTFSLNPAAFRALEEPDAVELLYDPERRLIGFRKVPVGSKYSYQVRPISPGASTWIVSGMAFTSYYGIETTVARRWICHVDEEGLLILDLNEPGQKVTSNRERGKRDTAIRGDTSPDPLPGPTSDGGSSTAAPQTSLQATNAGWGGGTVS